MHFIFCVVFFSTIEQKSKTTGTGTGAGCGWEEGAVAMGYRDGIVIKI